MLTAQPTGLWQTVKDDFWEGVGFVNGAGDTLTYPLRHPILTVEGLGKTAYYGDILLNGLDYDGSAKTYFMDIGQGIEQGLGGVYGATYSTDPSTRGYAWGTMAGMGAGIALGPEGASFLGDLGVIGAGLVGQEVGLAVPTRYGCAFQSFSSDALLAREAVANGALIYRAGTVGVSESSETAQFWATVDPQTTSNYAQLYGLPSQNTRFNFFVEGSLNPGSSFITRPAPGIGVNPGGGIEVVTYPHSVSTGY